MAGPPDSSNLEPGRVGFAENYRMLSTITGQGRKLASAWLDREATL